MKLEDQQTLAGYLVKSFMQINKFNEDLAEVQSFTTECTVVHRRSMTPLYVKRPSHSSMVGSIIEDRIQTVEDNSGFANEG